MTLGGLAGLGAAFAFVLGLLFVTLRLLKGLPGLHSRQSEGPELRVLSRAPLTPKQGLATVRVGEKILVVGYGDGGVTAVGEVEEPVVVHAPAASNLRWAPVSDDDAPTAAAETEDAPTGLPFRQALGRALRQVKVFGWVLLAGLVIAAPAAASVEVAAPILPAIAAAQDAAQDAPSLSDVELPSMGITVGNGEGEDLVLEGPVGTVLFIGFLTLLPTLLLLMTSFTRILVVLHLLKQALGTQTAPPAHLITAMAMLLTGFVMSPALQTANETAVRPWLDGEMDELQMMQTASMPFRAFMLENVREQDLGTFMEMSNTPPVQTVEEIPLVVLASAFVTSELRAAFQMGFALFLPFVIIDVVVASVLMSMGMFMLPPVMVSLPFKLLLFVLVDGWGLVMGSIVKSFA